MKSPKQSIKILKKEMIKIMPNWLRHVVLMCGVLAVIGYALHVVLGTLAYEGYNPMAQAVSDLTADDAPGKTVGRIFSGLYGVFSVLALGFIVFKQSLIKDKRLKWALMTLLVMLLVSAVGYGLFPLSSAGYQGTFTDVMHMVVTGVVVVFTLLALVLFMLYFYGMNHRRYFTFTVLVLLVLLVSPLVMLMVPQSYFGLVERFSVYGVVAYFFMIVWYVYRYNQLIFTEVEGF